MLPTVRQSGSGDARRAEGCSTSCGLPAVLRRAEAGRAGAQETLRPTEAREDDAAQDAWPARLGGQTLQLPGRPCRPGRPHLPPPSTSLLNPPDKPPFLLPLSIPQISRKRPSGPTHAHPIPQHKTPPRRPSCSAYSHSRYHIHLFLLVTFLFVAFTGVISHHHFLSFFFFQFSCNQDACRTRLLRISKISK